MPYLSYACEIWGNTFPSKLTGLATLQKKAIRVVDKAQYQAHTNPIFVKYGCLKFQDIVNLKTRKVIFQAKNCLLPVNIQKFFTKSQDVHNYNTRSTANNNFNALIIVGLNYDLWLSVLKV